MRAINFKTIIFIFALAVFNITVSAQDIIIKSATAPPQSSQANVKAAFSADTIPTSLYWLQTPQISTVFTDNGQFGVGMMANQQQCNNAQCPSFESPAGSNLKYLFAGMLWIGGIINSDTLVSTGADAWFAGDNEIRPAFQGGFFHSPSDFSIWTLMADTNITGIGNDPVDNRPHIPLHLRIANRAHIWNSNPYNNMIIYDMVITNIGSQIIHNGVFGICLDADVFHTLASSSNGFADDLTGSLPDAGIGYAIDNNGDPVFDRFDYRSPCRAIALKYLATSFPAVDSSYNWWVSNANASQDFGPRQIGTAEDPYRAFGPHLGTPTGDRNKYYIMHHHEWDYDQCRTDSFANWIPPQSWNLGRSLASGADTRFLMSLGNFNLLPDSSARILFTIFTGDSVHLVVNNLDNLPSHPDWYLANLDFSRVRANAASADILTGQLLHPELPVTGLHVQNTNADSTVIEWDPYVFPEVSGYRVYLYEVPLADLPHSGVVPPWMHAPVLNPVADLGTTYRHKLDTLKYSHFYLVNVANRLNSGFGDPGDPLVIQPGGRYNPPIPLEGAVFMHGFDPVTITWTAPDGVDVDHYNVYKFDSWNAAESKYYAHYDTMHITAMDPPADSSFQDGSWYFYYARTPHMQLDSGTTRFSESTHDSSVFVITAVDKFGLESAFSSNIIALSVPLCTKDILIVSCMASQDMGSSCESIGKYYADVLSGYSYDLYSMSDTLNKYPANCKPEMWRDFLPYRIVILDPTYRYDLLYTTPTCDPLQNYEHYLQSGGTLAHFGQLWSLTGQTQNSPPKLYALNDGFMQTYFGAQSVYDMGFAYYNRFTSQPLIDTILGLISALGAQDTIPSVAYDPLLDSVPTVLWPQNTAPSSSAFVVNGQGTVIQNFHSLYPATSRVDGQPVGVKTVGDNWTTYLFGYHLWYMNKTDARALIDYMMNTVRGACTIDPPSISLRANATRPPAGIIYLGNLTGGRSVDDIDVSTITINDVLVPTEAEILTSYPGFTGHVLKLTYGMIGFMDSYGVILKGGSQGFSVSASLHDGAALFAGGSFTTDNYIAGDANNDGRVNVGDVIYLINYIFKSWPSPQPPALGDSNCNYRTSLEDIVYLINFIFKNGPPPCLGDK
jgi:hypothetical protein